MAKICVEGLPYKNDNIRSLFNLTIGTGIIGLASVIVAIATDQSETILNLIELICSLPFLYFFFVFSESCKVLKRGITKLIYINIISYLLLDLLGFIVDTETGIGVIIETGLFVIFGLSYLAISIQLMLNFSGRLGELGKNMGKFLLLCLLIGIILYFWLEGSSSYGYYLPTSFGKSRTLIKALIGCAYLIYFFYAKILYLTCEIMEEGHSAATYGLETPYLNVVYETGCIWVEEGFDFEERDQRVVDITSGKELSPMFIATVKDSLTKTYYEKELAKKDKLKENIRHLKIADKFNLKFKFPSEFGKKTYLVISIIAIVILGGSGIGYVIYKVNQDSETEKKIVGTWTSTTEEYEDGMRIALTFTETYKEDGTYEAEGEVKITQPMYANIGKISYSGTWSASKTKLMCEIDENSVAFNLSNLLDASAKREFKSDMISELKKHDYIEGGEILKITDTELFIRDEWDESIIRYQRVGTPVTSSASEKVISKNEISDNMDTNVREINPDNDNSSLAESNATLPDWVTPNILTAFENEDLTIMPNQYLIHNYKKISDANPEDFSNYTGYVDSYPIKMELRIDREGNAEGRYAYLSTLKKYGDSKDSWFPLKGVVLGDFEDTPYLLLESRNPKDNQVFEYALIQYSPSDNWSGKLFNVKYLSDPNMKFHSMRIELDN